MNDMKSDQIIKISAFALSAFITLIAGITWLTTIQLNGKSNTESINEIQASVADMAKDLNKVQTDVALIKQAVGADRTVASVPNR